MSEDLHNIDDLFKAAFDGQEEKPPGNIWENIDNSLDKRNVVALHKKYVYVKRIAAALLAFAFAVGIYALEVQHRNKQVAKTDRVGDRHPGANKNKSVGGPGNKGSGGNEEIMDSENIDSAADFTLEQKPSLIAVDSSKKAAFLAENKNRPRAIDPAETDNDSGIDLKGKAAVDPFTPRVRAFKSASIKKKIGNNENDAYNHNPILISRSDLTEQMDPGDELSPSRIDDQQSLTE